MITLCFPGTRGNSDLRSPLHQWHSCLIAEYQGFRLLIDCGDDWRGRLAALSPHAILLTHAHPDHAWGLADGAPCAAYATEATWQSLASVLRSPFERHTIQPLSPFPSGPFLCQAFALEHSTVAPAVGYRITAADITLVYCPDVAYIHDRKHALAGAQLYVGDGASLRRSLVRKRGEALIGHAPIVTQLTWCQKESVPRAVFTHCGNEVIAGHEAAQSAIQAEAAKRGLQAMLAYDGLQLKLQAQPEEQDRER